MQGQPHLCQMMRRSLRRSCGGQAGLQLHQTARTTSPKGAQSWEQPRLRRAARQHRKRSCLRHRPLAGTEVQCRRLTAQQQEMPQLSRGS